MKCIFFSSKKLLLNSAKTCFIPNHTVIRIKQDRSCVTLFTLQGGIYSKSLLLPRLCWDFIHKCVFGFVDVYVFVFFFSYSFSNYEQKTWKNVTLLKPNNIQFSTLGQFSFPIVFGAQFWVKWSRRYLICAFVFLNIFF